MYTFQLEILIINVITGIVYFHEIILESSRNVNETTPPPSDPQLWAPERPAQLSIQQLVQANNKENIKALHC